LWQAELWMALATVFAEEIEKPLHSLNLEGVANGASLAARIDEPCSGQLFEVKRKSVGRDVELLGDLARGQPSSSSAYQEAKRLQPGLLGEGVERHDCLIRFHNSRIIEIYPGRVKAG